MTTPDNVRSMHANLFARDGHLTMLTLDRFEVGELSTVATEAVIEHLELCSCCADRLGQMRADAVELTPPAACHPASRQRPWTGLLAIAGTVAAAAALLTVVWPQPQQAERARGEQARLSASPYTTTAEFEGALSFAPAVDLHAVLADDGKILSDGDPVASDARVRIEVSPHEAGFLAVISASESDDLSADGDTDGSAAVADIEVLMPVTQLAARSGPHGMELEVETTAAHFPSAALQRVIAIYCADAFSLEVEGRFDPDLPDLDEGCTSVELSLERVHEVADS